MFVPSLDRTPSSHSRHVTEGIWCFERPFPGQERRPPVRLVVFDCDETLTLSTFLPRDMDLRRQIGWSQWAEYITTMNFESPFLRSSRTEHLQAMLSTLVSGEGGQGGCKLALLTRNQSGVIACLNLLSMGNLAQYFDAMWCMSSYAGVSCGVYRDGSEWKSFDPPVGGEAEHKADVLQDVTEDVHAWFPGASGEGLENLRMEEIVLVDDVRTNFQSPRPGGPKVVRYCKVARYDSKYRELGFVRDMGGIGARCEADYRALIDFVWNPWHYKAELAVRCSQEPNGQETREVDLVLFDFDETLTLYTFMPEEARCASEIGFLGSKPEARERCVTYNFRSPYLEGDRVVKLRQLLADLVTGEDGHVRTLAVLAENEAGAVAVLNLLMMADLARYFSAIWTLAAEIGKPNGVFRVGDEWRTFLLPVVRPSSSKNERQVPSTMDVLQMLVAKPSDWFPQLQQGTDTPEEFRRLAHLELEGIVLVDDERRNFRADAEEEDAPRVHRTCEVARYDDDYRDKGLLVHMGGVGAKTDQDYDVLRNFVAHPWEYRVKDPDPEASFAALLMDPAPDGAATTSAPTLVRHETDEGGPLCRRDRRVKTEPADMCRLEWADLGKANASVGEGLYRASVCGAGNGAS